LDDAQAAAPDGSRKAHVVAQRRHVDSCVVQSVEQHPTLDNLEHSVVDGDRAGVGREGGHWRRLSSRSGPALDVLVARCAGPPHTLGAAEAVIAGLPTYLPLERRRSGQSSGLGRWLGGSRGCGPGGRGVDSPKGRSVSGTWLAVLLGRRIASWA